MQENCFCTDMHTKPLSLCVCVCVCVSVCVCIQVGSRPGREGCVPGSSCTKACIVFKERGLKELFWDQTELSLVGLLAVRCIFN